MTFLLSPPPAPHQDSAPHPKESSKTEGSSSSKVSGEGGERQAHGPFEYGKEETFQTALEKADKPIQHMKKDPKDKGKEDTDQRLRSFSSDVFVGFPWQDMLISSSVPDEPHMEKASPDISSSAPMEQERTLGGERRLLSGVTLDSLDAGEGDSATPKTSDQLDAPLSPVMESASLSNDSFTFSPLLKRSNLAGIPSPAFPLPHASTLLEPASVTLETPKSIPRDIAFAATISQVLSQTMTGIATILEANPRDLGRAPASLAKQACDTPDNTHLFPMEDALPLNLDDELPTISGEETIPERTWALSVFKAKREPAILSLPLRQTDTQAQELDLSVLVPSPLSSPTQGNDLLERGETVLGPLPLSDVPQTLHNLGTRFSTLKIPLQTLELRLSPEHLGPLKITLSLKDDALSIHVSCHALQTVETLKNTLVGLEDLLKTAALVVEHRPEPSSSGHMANNGQQGQNGGTSSHNTPFGSSDFSRPSSHREKDAQHGSQQTFQETEPDETPVPRLGIFL